MFSFLIGVSNLSDAILIILTIACIYGNQLFYYFVY